MPCQCQLCPSTDATVHLTELTPAGERTELHLCRACIARLELVMEPPPSIAAILEAQAEHQAADENAEAPTPNPPAKSSAPARCPVCGLEWTGYVQNNLLGCPDCWLSFLDQLDPLLERYHGTKQHEGRRPANAPSTATVTRKAANRRTRAARRNELQAALNEAVKHERYELAASLRDQLQTLEQDSSDTGQEER